MLWFFERDKQSLRVETRYDNGSSQFVVIVTWPDGREQTERFADPEVCRTWLTDFDQSLEAERWTPNRPVILPYGWPDKKLN
jgi:hypothetical protein